MLRIGVIVLVANAALMSLQLLAGSIIAPATGSSLETWTAVIAAYLTGISLGNWYGGRFADRRPTFSVLRMLLIAGTACCLWPLIVAFAVEQFAQLGLPFFAMLILPPVVGLPPAFILSVITPLAIRLSLRDIRQTGEVTGRIYALATLGALAGNFGTGAVLVAYFGVTTLHLAATGAMLAMIPLVPKIEAAPSPPVPEQPSMTELSLRVAGFVVFVCSFCAMSLEILASRLLAPVVGSSLLSWTGIIGVVLAGTALGNRLGGILADRTPSRVVLGACVFTGGALTLAVLINFAALSRLGLDESYPLMGQILIYAVVLFMPPLVALGMITPQVTRLCVNNHAQVGQLAGGLYAISCIGALLGTLATGWVLIATFGGLRLVLLLSLILVILGVVVGQLWRRPAPLYAASIVGGSALSGIFLTDSLTKLPTLETNYFTINVRDKTWRGVPVKALELDRLIHSLVKPGDLHFLGYEHEEVEAELVRLAASRNGNSPSILVIGGGGYTLPIWAETVYPQASIDVVEIDPGVTAIARSHLNLSSLSQIRSHHMDGRQFVLLAPERSYDIIVQDVVNDFSVPRHLLTAEYFRGVRRLLRPGGLLCLTVIDVFAEGNFLRSVVRTLQSEFTQANLLTVNPQRLRERYPHETGLPSTAAWDRPGRGIFVVAATDKPWSVTNYRDGLKQLGIDQPWGLVLADGELQKWMSRQVGVRLTDDFAPVDHLLLPLSGSIRKK